MGNIVEKQTMFQKFELMVQYPKTRSINTHTPAHVHRCEYTYIDGKFDFTECDKRFAELNPSDFDPRHVAITRAFYTDFKVQPEKYNLDKFAGVITMNNDNHIQFMNPHSLSDRVAVVSLEEHRFGLFE
jgi:hypothetical protein